MDATINRDTKCVSPQPKSFPREGLHDYAHAGVLIHWGQAPGGLALRYHLLAEKFSDFGGAKHTSFFVITAFEGCISVPFECVLQYVIDWFL